MHDVNGCACNLGQSNRATYRLCLGGRGTSERVIFGGLLSLGESLLDDYVNRAAVFRVHADQAAVLRRSLQSFEDAAVVEHEHTGIRHEKFEAGDAFMHEIVHLRKLSTRYVGDDAVKRVVADSFIRSFVHPCFERLSQRLAFVLDREVDERGRASEGRSACASFEVVSAHRATERHVEMRMNVNSSGEHEFAGCIQYFG